MNTLLLALLLLASGLRGETDGRPLIVAFGDSLTAGAGVAKAEAWPALLQERLDREGYGYRVLNAGVSGDTTAGGLRRLDRVLEQGPAIVILELGANDGLRGLPVPAMRDSLSRIIRRLKARRVRVVLAGIKLPRNYGKEYTEAFEAVFPALAEKHRTAFIPFLLDGVALDPALNQGDGLHPNAAGHGRVLENVWDALEPLLKKPATSLPTSSPHPWSLSRLREREG